MPKGLRFQWDSRKSLKNKGKHNVSFEEAAQVFGDSMAITIQDPDHGNDDEIREITIGQSGKNRILAVSSTERDGAIRIISARKAEKHEINQYNER